MSITVIGISGKTGAGKTTIAKILAKKLHAVSLFWDDFDGVSKSPENYVEWYDRGQDYGEWQYNSLASTLHTLKQNKSVTHPVFNHIVQPTSYIVFDAPLGRLHTQTGKYIDFCIYLDTPLDVLLARRILRDFKTDETSKEDLLKEVDYYLHHSRKLFFDDDLKTSADLIISGVNTTEAQIIEIEQHINHL